MNFADALRQAAKNSGYSLPSELPTSEAPATKTFNETRLEAQPLNDNSTQSGRPQLEVVELTHDTSASKAKTKRKPQVVKVQAKTKDIATDPVTAEAVPTPTPPNVQNASGNVVRLELFLTPEQLNGLFKAVVANQHTVMTLREAASYLRVSSTRLVEMAQEGDIPAFLIDGKWRFPRNSVDEWLNMQSFCKEMEA